MASIKDPARNESNADCERDDESGELLLNVLQAYFSNVSKASTATSKVDNGRSASGQGQFG